MSEWVAVDDARRSGRPGGTGGRIVVLLVLLGFLAGGIALSRRTPDVTPARVTAVGVDGPVVPPADALSTAWYCAAGTSAAGGAEDETIHVANLSPRAISATVTVDPGSGDDPRTTHIGIDPYERSSLRVGEVLPTASPGVVVEVDGGPAIVEHEIGGNGDLAMNPCAEEPADTWYFSAGGTARGSAQALELFNPFGDDAIVDITFLTEGGVQEPQALQGFVVGRRSKVVVPVQDLVPRQERVATVVRTRTGRVVAEQIRTFDGTDGRSGLTLALGATAPRRRWTLPVAGATTGATGVVTISNFGLAPAEVEVSVLLSGEGVLAPETVDVPSRSVVNFDPSPRVPAGDAYAIVVRAQGNTPVVAETLLDASRAATATGASTSARRWALAGSPTRASSAVLAVNRGSRPLTVELRAYTAGDVDSPTSAPAIAVAPGKVARFDLDEWGIDADQVLVVSADGPIVVGRETYAGGVSLALGVPFGR
ncbi:MAG: DUF5719 family protein [Acidimicrobiia bacterium]|jgi:hypothetical protein